MFDRKRVFGLLWPVLIEQTFAVLINILATVMVRSVSQDAVAGVGMLGNLNFMMMNAFTAVATGVTVVVSQCIGRGDPETAGKASANALTTVVYASAAISVMMIAFARPILNFLFGNAEKPVLDAAYIYLVWLAASMPLQAIFSTIAGVMRSVGNSRTPMLGSVLSNLMYVLAAGTGIYLLGFGVHGAGLGLLFSRLVPTVFLALLLYRGRQGIYLPRLSFKIDWKIMRPVLRVAVPAGVDSLIFNGGKLLVQVFMSGMGTDVLFANSVVNNLSSFINLPGGSLQVVSVTVVGQTFGARRFKEAQKQILTLTGVNMLIALAVSLLYWPLTGWTINLFGPSEGALIFARQVMLFILIATPALWPSSFVMPQGLRAAGEATYTMWVSIVSMIVLRILGAWFFGVFLDMKLFGIWLSMVIDWVGRSAFFLPRVLTLAKRNEAK